ncbi:MAG TPA: TonB-dependent receptor [Burkholderiales bacterium]|nr:TonB-dependent receptor [Burkholderiales bacterium]
MKKRLGGLAFATLCSPAVAQEDVVVVTATRGPQPALEIPASIDRIYGEEIREDRQQVNLSESLGRVPGIAVQNRQNYAQDLQIQSRGFGARSTFGVRGIRLIADGIPATMPDGQGQAATFALGSAERIEVLRGPFSALYGNASGGVIAVETMDGPARPTAEADLLLGSYRTHRGALKFGGQFGAMNAIGDVSRFETDGYRQHSATTRDHLNAKLKWDSFTVVANSLRQPDTQDPLGLTRAQMEQDPRQATPQAFQFNTKKSIAQDQVGGTYRHALGGSSRAEAMAYVGQRTVEQYLAIPVATQRGSATHSGGIVNLDRNYGGGALRWFGAVSAVRLSAGLEHDAMYERRKGFVNDNGTQAELRRDEDNTVKSTALYGQAEWKLAERWALHGGLRHTRVDFHSSDYYVVAGNANDSGSRGYRATTPVLGLVFRASQNTSVYGNLGRGFETPTFVELAYRNGGSGLNFGLDASRSRHSELGVKTIVPNFVRLNAAVFKVVTENEIVVDTNSGGRAIFKNVGHTDRKGLELGAETLLPGRFQLRAAYTYLDATFREGFNTSITTTAAQVPVPAGATLPGVAKNQFYTELRYKQAPFHASVEALHRTGVPVNDPNTDFADGFTVVNLAAGLVQERSRWRFMEFVRLDNAANRNYVGSVIVNETNARYFEPAPRRNMSVGLRASVQF